MTEQDFDIFYGKGMYKLVLKIINDLGPGTRRDEWWATDGPYEIIARHFAKERNTIRVALGELLERYTGLVNCGDCGNWDPETELEVIFARAALQEKRP